MPGYTGYTAGINLVAGRSYGRSTRRAMKHPGRDLYERDLIPASPQLKDKLRVPLRATHSIGALPGYTGYIGSSRFQFGQRYSEMTVMVGHTTRSLGSSWSRKELNHSSAKFTRTKAVASKGVRFC